MAKYRNSFYNELNRDSKMFIETNAKPVLYKGYLIYESAPKTQFDVVLNDICIALRAGINGAKSYIDGLSVKNL